MKNYLYLGPVTENLEKKKKQGRKGWCIPIKDLEEAIKLYTKDPEEPEGPEYDCVVFSVNGQDLSILGVNKVDGDDPTAISSSNSPRNPGEFDQFPPWP